VELGQPMSGSPMSSVKRESLKSDEGQAVKGGAGICRFDSIFFPRTSVDVLVSCGGEFCHCSSAGSGSAPR
jgi:hypothetical protein